MLALRSGAKRVRALVADRVRIERGSLSTSQSPRVAVIAHWSVSARLTRSVCALVNALQSCGYRVIVASACQAPEELIWDATVDVDELVVIRKPNIGHDFGSWSMALGLIPDIARAERVIIANDSMAGPFVQLRPFLEQFERTPADVWGLTDTQQFAPHLQSYFLGFCDGILRDRPLMGFWSRIRSEADKMQVILRNEIGLGRLLHEEGYVQHPAFPHERFVRPGQNPVIMGWRDLLEAGFPFLKREIVRAPTIAPAGHTAPMAVMRLFGTSIDDWVDDRAAVT
jgi:lipopolysaccharide biosynthesis protein